MLNVGRIEIYDIIHATGRNVIKQVERKIAVRINDAHSMTRFDVFEDHIAKQCRLARTAFADDVEMLSSVGAQNTEGLASAPDFAIAENCDCIMFQSEAPIRIRHTLCLTSRRGNGDSI
jgi:hypothetical protein